MTAKPSIGGAIEPSLKSSPPRDSLLTRCGGFAGRLFDRLIGLISMVACLATVSVFPVLNLLSLGYLLEASSRVAVSGRFRDGFVGINTFARLGKIVLGCWLWTLPLRLVYDLWQDAELISAGSTQAGALKVLLAFLIVAVWLHLVAALLRGAKLRHFLIPSPLRWIRWIADPGMFPRCRTPIAVLGRVGIRAIEFGKTGLLGFAGAALWLALPVLILFFSSLIERQGLALISSFTGAVLLGAVALLLPFLQTRFSVTRRFRDFFALSPIRKQFRRAPVAFWLALLTTLLFALPLYLLKIELTPREVAWLPNVVFVLFIFPARLLLGWAVHRGENAYNPKHRSIRWLSMLLAIPVAGTYAFTVWLSQYLSWHGSYSLFEQHAFLIPAPLFGL